MIASMARYILNGLGEGLHACAYSTQGTHMGTFVTIWVPFRVVKYTGPTLSHPTDPAQTNHPWDPLSIPNDGLALDGVASAY